MSLSAAAGWFLAGLPVGIALAFSINASMAFVSDPFDIESDTQIQDDSKDASHAP